MGAETTIAWTDHTFNPWWGCTKVSPGCDHCYAETFDRRVGGKHWGKDAPRRVFGEKHWNEPKNWNELAAKEGVRKRVFCASMADVFDADAPEGQLERLWALIRETPHLDWLLLTKRPSRIRRALPADWGTGYANVWLGTTVEDQQRADERIPVLLDVPARVRFLSIEPQIGPVDLDLNRCDTHDRDFIGHGHPDLGDYCTECAADRWSGELSIGHWLGDPDDGIHWVIVGGESGPGARPFDVGWARSVVKQCKRYGTAVFVKQLGGVPVLDEVEWRTHDQRLLSATNKDRAPAGTVPLKTGDRKGGDPSEWPADLRVREFPEVCR
jgi:protein gp37